MAEIEWTDEAKYWLQQIRIAYLIRDEKTIHILGVLHGALDIDEHLRRIL